VRNERLPREYFFSEEYGGYITDIPDLSHCSAFGETPQQALAEVLKAKAGWIEAARAEGKPVPSPKRGRLSAGDQLSGRSFIRHQKFQPELLALPRVAHRHALLVAGNVACSARQQDAHDSFVDFREVGF
jgi:predicted RNase H-like HicB family nuclease